MYIVVPRIPTLFSLSSILDSGMIYNIKALTTFWSSSVFLLYHPCVSPGCLSVRHMHTVPWEARRWCQILWIRSDKHLRATV